MRKALLMSTAAIIVASLLLIGSTYAYFSDSATSGGSFDAGSIDTKIKDNDEAWGDSVSVTWSSYNMKPGDELPFAVPTVNIKNVGTVSAATLDIGASNSVPGHIGEPAENMDRFMEIRRMEYTDGIPTVNLLDHIVDYNVNGWKDLDDLENASALGMPAPVGVGDFSMDLRFRPEADGTFQGMMLVVDFHFRLNQSTS